MGAAHLLMEMVVVRFDGGAHQPQNEEMDERLPPLDVRRPKGLDPRGPTASKCQVVKSKLFTGKPEDPT